VRQQNIRAAVFSALPYFFATAVFRHSEPSEECRAALRARSFVPQVDEEKANQTDIDVAIASD
jgi:hypothetical protein